MAAITNLDPFQILLPDSAVTVSGGVAVADITTLISDADADIAVAQADATQALADASIVWLAVQLPDATATGAPGVSVVAPVTGEFTHMVGVFAGAAPPSAAVEVFASVVGGGGPAGSVSLVAADTPVADSPVADNAVTAFTSVVNLEPNTANVTAGNVTILLGFTRA